MGPRQGTDTRRAAPGGAPARAHHDGQLAGVRAPVQKIRPKDDVEGPGAPARLRPRVRLIPVHLMHPDVRPAARREPAAAASAGRFACFAAAAGSAVGGDVLGEVRHRPRVVV